MRRTVLTSFLFFLFHGFFNPALALETIAVRGSAQSGYSRLVFAWPSSTDYTLEKFDAQTLVVKFKKGANLDARILEKSGLNNISGLSVLKSDPLSVLIKIPEKSQTRDLRVGNRIMIDIFDPPGGAHKAKSLSVQKIEQEGKPEEKKDVSHNLSDASVQKSSKEEKPKGALKGKSAEKEEKIEKPAVIETQTPVVTDVKSETIKSKTKEPPTMILLSSTQVFGLAAFVLDGKLFVANDKSDLFLKPQINGPQAKSVGSFQDVLSDAGKVFFIQPPAGSQYKGQGGGLVWRILFSSQTTPREGVDPRREGTSSDKDRGGKIIWPLQTARSVLNLKDPQSGRTIKIVTVEKADQSGGDARRFIDFDVLPSPIGLAIVPKVDDLDVKISGAGVEISRPSGLTLVDDSFATTAKISASVAPSPEIGAGAQRLYDFRNWQLGGLSAVAENRTILLEGLKDLSDGGKSESLLTLGKMYLSNALGHEAEGVLRFALTDSPLLEENPEFMALRGASEIISGHFEDGFKTLSMPQLSQFIETNYWRAAALAGLGDWQQAAAIMPKDLSVVSEYPPAIQNRLIPVLAEISLRSGDVNQGKKFLEMLDKNEKMLSTPQAAALTYLKGEAARQEGKTDKTKELWGTLINGKDDLYRVKTGLALTRLLVDKKELTPAKAIDSLERLRYAWRGDDLEAHINAWLGRTYFESADYIKGLKIMREAATYVPQTDLAQRIAGDMSDLFMDLFLSEKLDAISPLDAVAVYNEFSDLMPRDERGDQVVERLAEHLVKSDLLGRAAELLDYQLKNRLTGEQAYRIGVRLAAIRLLDSEPEKAMAVLNLAQQKFNELPEEMKTSQRALTLSLLRARALSRQGRPDQALAMLREMQQGPDVNRLRADIAWSAGYWDDASEALGDVILDQNISLTKPLNEKNIGFILQRAIALNLASDRLALADMRAKYSELMNQTPKGKIFEVITRPRQSAGLSDRETLLGVVSEVDLFSDFLNSYKSMQTPEKTPAAPAVSPPAAAAPPQGQNSGSANP